jgi:hypothetical protein
MSQFYLNWKTSGQTDTWTHGHMDTWTHGQIDRHKWIKAYSNMNTNVGKYYNFIRIEIQVDRRTNGLMDRETDRQMDRRLDGYK